MEVLESLEVLLLEILRLLLLCIFDRLLRLDEAVQSFDLAGELDDDGLQGAGGIGLVGALRRAGVGRRQVGHGGVVGASPILQERVGYALSVLLAECTLGGLQSDLPASHSQRVVARRQTRMLVLLH